jgi:uncharacterized protein with HEPN domain
MSLERDDRAYLWDMLTAARAVVSFVQGRTLEDYLGDLLLRSAVERQVEIIGEAARRVSREFQDAHPEFPGGQFRHSGTFWRTITVKSNMIGSGVWQLNMFQP